MVRASSELRDAKVQMHPDPGPLSVTGSGLCRSSACLAPGVLPDGAAGPGVFLEQLDQLE
jgi:hypothetical protein